jgi:hypothetical protein
VRRSGGFGRPFYSIEIGPTADNPKPAGCRHPEMEQIMTRYLAFAGLVALALCASLSATPAIAQTVAAGGYSIDLHPVLSDILTVLAAGAAGMVAWVGRKAATLLHLKISSQTSDMLEQAAYKAATFGLGRVQDLIAAKGWDHPEVKSQAVALAIPYFTSRFPEALKAAGVNVNDPVALSATVEGLLERIFPAAARDAAKSPATPDESLKATAIGVGAVAEALAPPVAPPAPARPAVAAVVGAILLFGATLGLSACGTPGQSAQPSVGAVATQAAPAVVDVAAAIDPQSAAKIDALCPVVTSGLSIIQSCLTGGAAGPTGAVGQLKATADASCTEAGKLQLKANDAQAKLTGPTVSNSGNSGGFLAGLLANGAKFAPIACPIAQALLKAS